jgi:hypothetical protein
MAMKANEKKVKKNTQKKNTQKKKTVNKKKDDETDKFLKAKYKASLKSDKYHKKGCHYPINIRDYNRVWSNNRQKVINEGKENKKPCSVCKPD